MTFIKNAAGTTSAFALTLIAALSSATSAQAQDVTATVFGRLNLDYTSADLDGPDGTIEESELRRGRIGVKGQFSDAIDYKIEFNKAEGDSINLEDAYLDFKPESLPFKIRVGQDNTTNSLDELTSSRFSSTIERAAFTDAFALDRRLGVLILSKGDNWTFDAGVFTENLEGGEFEKDGRAASARATFTPVKSDEMTVHLGGSVRFTEAADDADLDSTSDLIRYRQRPYTHAAPSRIISTPRFADSDTFIGVEGAVLRDGLWVAGEYVRLSADGAETTAGLDLDGGTFDGAYIEAGYIFGGRRTYKGGKFNRPKIDAPLGAGGAGAFGVVARYDTLDLTDNAYAGKLDTLVLGVDWYPTGNTRLALNYFDADATDGSADKASGFVTRLYFDF